ncbi:MAG: HK97 family phage prohead protease, partial [Cellulomonas sp.]|nr:HK97 family phage prohead protease [Cellulomonas sp.]
MQPHETTTERLAVREFTVRATSPDRAEFTGIAVPWDDEVQISDWLGSYTETFARSSIATEGDVLVFWRHREPIGVVTSHRDTDDGWEVTATLSPTSLGADAATLLRDGVISSLSVGFRPVEQITRIDGDGAEHVTRTRVIAREVSLVPNPAYPGAEITSVRHQPTQGDPMPTDTATDTPTADLVTLRESVEQIGRTVADLANRSTAPNPTSTFPTAGDLLKALVTGDETAKREYTDTLTRAWNPAGAVLADGVDRPSWVGDLTRLVDEPAVLAGVFSTGPLPAEGTTLEYGQLGTDTTQVTKQTAEGADLAFGKVAVTTATATIGTYGGYTRLSVQAIERARVNLLNHHLNAMALAAGRRRNAVYRDVYATAVAAQVAASNTVEVDDPGEYADWIGALVDAAEKFQDLGLTMDTLLVDATMFKTMATMTAADGRPMLVVSGTGANIVGQVDLRAIRGDLASLPGVMNPKQTAPGAAFVNRQAIR